MLEFEIIFMSGTPFINFTDFYEILMSPTCVIISKLILISVITMKVNLLQQMYRNKHFTYLTRKFSSL